MTHNLHNLFPHASDVPAPWLSILSLVQIESGTVPVLGGGALRDHFHGVPVKDLDIFLTYSEAVHDKLRHIFEIAGFTCIQSISPSCEGLNECVSVLGYRDDMGMLPDINIIFMDGSVAETPEEIVMRNDFGICQIGLFLTPEGKPQFVYSEAFIEDVIAETFTLTREGDRERSLRRYERLRQKYPKHRLVYS